MKRRHALTPFVCFPPCSSSGLRPTGWAAPCTRVQEWTCGGKSGRTPFTSCATIPPSEINIPACPSRRPHLGSSHCCSHLFSAATEMWRRKCICVYIPGPLKFHWQLGLKNNNEARGKKNSLPGFNCLTRQRLCFHSVSETNYKAMSSVRPDWPLVSTLLTVPTVDLLRGNWIGEAPYQHGRPCSQCPPSYGGGCKNNLCFKGERPSRGLDFLGSAACPQAEPDFSPPPLLAAESQRSETEDMNEVEKPQAPAPPRTTAKPAPKPKPSAPKKPASRTPSSDTSSNTYLGIEDEKVN